MSICWLWIVLIWNQSSFELIKLNQDDKIFFALKVYGNVSVYVTIRHHDGTNELTHDCPEDEDQHVCNKIGRFVYVEVASDKAPSVSPSLLCELIYEVQLLCIVLLPDIWMWYLSTDTYINYYVGCFKVQSNVTIDNATSIEDCRKFCFSKDSGFAGINKVCGYLRAMSLPSIDSFNSDNSLSFQRSRPLSIESFLLECVVSKEKSFQKQSRSSL